MAVYTIQDWSKLNKDNNVGNTNYQQGTVLGGGSNELVNFAGIEISGKAPSVSGGTATTITGFTGNVGVGIYKEGTGNTYAFASTAVSTGLPTKVNSYELIASATGSTGTWNSADKSVGVKSMNLTLASGSGKILGFAAGSSGNTNKTGVNTITGSAGDDRVFIRSYSISSTAVLNFGQGGADSVYFLGTSSIGSATGSDLTLAASTNASTAGGYVVLGSAISTSFIADGGSGDAMKVAAMTGKNLTLNAKNIGGTVILGDTGNNKNTITVGTVNGGKASINLGSGGGSASVTSLATGDVAVTGGNGADSVKVGTITGGALVVTAGGGAGATDDTISIAGMESGSFNLKDFSSGKDVVSFGTISGGTGTVSVAASGNGSITGAITDGRLILAQKAGTITAGSGTSLSDVVLNSGSKNGLEISGSKAMNIIASASTGLISIAGSSAADSFNLGKIGDLSTVVVVASGTADGLSVSSIGSESQLILANGTGSVTFGSGSKFADAALSYDTGVKLAGSTGVVSLVGASISGNAAFSGSSKDDYFNVDSLASANNLTLTGGSGNDGYYFGANVAGNVTITDFGWSTSSEEAKNSALGLDVIYVDNVESSTLGKIQLVGSNVVIGSNNLIATAENTEYVYAKIAASGTDASAAKTYRIGSSGAKVVGSDSSITVTGTTGSDGTITYNASSEEHAYINPGSADAVVNNMTAYNGSNDRTASIIDTAISLDNMTQTTDSSGNVVLSGSDSDPTVTINNLGVGKAIKVGGKTESEQTAIVLGAATGTTTVESAIGDEALKTAYIGDSTAGSFFDFSQTDKTTIDLSGASTVDGATYKNVKGVKGSDNGSSLLVSGSNAVTLEAAGKSDTLSGAGAGADTLVSASGKATNFLLSSGNGNDVVSGFSFGTGANDDKVLISDTGFGEFADAETLVSASNGRIRVGNDNGTLVINASGRDTVAVQFNFGGSNPGTLMLDTSDNGAVLNFASGSNIIMGQSGVTTVKAAAGDTVEAKDASVPAGIGWNSNYIVSSVGVVDVSASDMTAVNGQKNSSDMVVAATGTSLEGPIWVCGGIGANFSDTGNDTLVASGNGNNEIFVGAKMGNDIIQKVSSKDKITFIDTKVSDFGGIDKVLTIDTTGNSFTAVFAGTAGTSTTIKGTTQLAMDKTTNLTFHFDDADYVWDGKTLTEATA